MNYNIINMYSKFNSINVSINNIYPYQINYRKLVFINVCVFPYLK